MTNGEREERGEPLEYDEHGIPILNVRARLSEVERKATEAETRDQNYKTRQESINRRLMIFTGLLVLTSLISGGIAIWQARIANRSAKAAESAAKTAASTLEDTEKPTSDVHISALAAKNAADTAAQALLSSQALAQADRRPYVVVEENSPQFDEVSPSFRRPIFVNINFKNIGKTPAINLISQEHFFPEHPKLLAELTLQQQKDESRRWVNMLEQKFSDMRTKDERLRIAFNSLVKFSAGRDLSPGQQMLVTPEESFDLKETDVPLLVSQRLELIAIGYISYTDTSGKIYSTDFCYQFVGPYWKIWHICDSHNKIK